jgi:lysophospholipase L1-like esterase
MHSSKFTAVTSTLVAGALIFASGCSSEIELGSEPAFPEPPPSRPAPYPCADAATDAAGSAASVATHSAFAKRHYRERLEVFAADPLDCGQVVMLGDSLTELNDWPSTTASSATLRNRGVSGDTSEGVLARMDELFANQPAAVFLMIGTNDLWSGITPETTVANIVRMSDQFRSRSPYSTLFVQTLPPLRGEPASWGGAPNDKVREINALLKRASGHGSFVILDTYALLADDKGMLNTAYTTDGMHLNEAGYAVWSKLVSETLATYPLPRTDR